jgi:hypothetical protein
MVRKGIFGRWGTSNWLLGAENQSKMARNGAGMAKNDTKTTKCAKNAKFWGWDGQK